MSNTFGGMSSDADRWLVALRVAWMAMNSGEPMVTATHGRRSKTFTSMRTLEADMAEAERACGRSFGEPRN